MRPLFRGALVLLLTLCRDVFGVGASINQADDEGNTALHTACFNEAASVVEFLLERRMLCLTRAQFVECVGVLVFIWF